MRAAIAIALVLLGADLPRHRRFVQRTLPAAGCSRASGVALVNGDWVDIIVANGTQPGRTQNAGLSAGCDNTAERFTFSATNAGGVSAVGNTNTAMCPYPVVTGKVSWGCWIRGHSGSGVTDQGTFNNVSWDTQLVSFTTTGRFFKVENHSYAVAPTPEIAIGNLSLVNGGNARAAVDIEVWGCRCVDGTTISQ